MKMRKTKPRPTGFSFCAPRHGLPRFLLFGLAAFSFWKIVALSVSFQTEVASLFFNA